MQGQQVALGNTALIDVEGVDWRPLQRAAEDLRRVGASVMYLALQGKLVGLIAVSDPIKQTTEEALTTLREAGMTVVNRHDYRRHS